MKEEQYRTASFSQDTRLQAAYDRRSHLIKEAEALDTPDDSLMERAKKAAVEFVAVYKVGGICEMLVMKWLKLKLTDDMGNKPPRQDLVPRANRIALIDRDKTADKAFERRFHQGANSGRYGVENYYGLLAKIEQYPGTGLPPTEWVAKTVAGSTHEYFHHQIVCPKFNGNHSLAYYTSGGKKGFYRHVYMFDPDYGEYKVPVGDFGKWLPKFLKFFYGTDSGDTNKLETMSLRPQGKVQIS